MKKLFSLLTLALLTMSAVAGNYVKVTSTADLTSGKYLIVYEDGNVAFNGALNSLDVASNTVAVTIENGVIAPKDAIIAAQFDIDVTAGTIKSASGYYIGQTSDANGMLTSTETAYTNTISITDGNADIKSSGNAYLRYNAASNQARFRYYKSSSYTGQKAIQLYKWDGEEDPVIGLMAPVFHPNGGEITQSTEVTLTCATENADIFYWEGTEQEQSEWIHYNAPFYVNETKTFTAVSTKGNDISDYVTVTFTKVTPKCAKPTFTPGNGTTFLQGEELDVTINCATEGASIMYTVNDNVYEGTAPVVVTLTESATITAVASAEGYTDSDEATASYTMVVPSTTGPVFALVSDITDLKAGDKIILVNSTEDGAAMVMGPINSNGRNFLGKNVVVNNGQVQTEDASIITLEQNGDFWNLKTSDKYIYAPGGSNYMQLESTVDEYGNANAAITVNADTTTIVFQGSGDRKIVRYNPNNGSPIFSCYNATSSVKGAIYIYKATEEIIEVAAPTFDPAACEFDESIDVTINCATEGATLHYVVGNGDDQTATAPVTVTLTKTTTITAYAELDGVESEIVEATYTLKEATGDITTLAQARALEDNTEFTFGGNVVVVYKNGSNLWVKDETASGLIYGSGLTNFEQGTVLNSGWSAKKVMYQTIIPEFSNPANVTASEQEKVTVEPTVVEISAIDASMMNDYIRINNVTIDSISSSDNKNYYANGMVLRNQFGGITLEAGKTYSLIGLATAYKGVPQVYITEVVDAPQPEVYDVNNIAEALALDPNSQFTMFNDVVVTYQNGSRLFIRDTDNGSGLIFGADGTFENGQVLSDGWTATYQLFNGNTPEFINPEGVEADGDETRDASPFERTTITAENVNEYVILKGVTLQADTTDTGIFYTAEGLQICNFFNGVEIPAVEEGKTYDVTGIVMISKAGVVRVYITEMTEAAAPAGLRGDVNNDTFVNISDVTVLIDYLLNPATVINEANANVNLDEAINISDVTVLIDFLLSGTWPNK